MEDQPTADQLEVADLIEGATCFVAYTVMSSVSVWTPVVSAGCSRGVQARSCTM